MYPRRRLARETIELGVRWYITHRRSYRDLVAMAGRKPLRAR
jgi:hypothetical protein